MFWCFCTRNNRSGCVKSWFNFHIKFWCHYVLSGEEGIKCFVARTITQLRYLLAKFCILNNRKAFLQTGVQKLFKLAVNMLDYLITCPYCLRWFDLSVPADNVTFDIPEITPSYPTLFIPARFDSHSVPHLVPQLVFTSLKYFHFHIPEHQCVCLPG